MIKVARNATRSVGIMLPSPANELIYVEFYHLVYVVTSSTSVPYINVLCFRISLFCKHIWHKYSPVNSGQLVNHPACLVWAVVTI